MCPNGLQYDKWRIAGDITVHRYKPWCGAGAFKLLSPTFVILFVELYPAEAATIQRKKNIVEN